MIGAYSLLGILLILGIAVLLSADRKAIRLRVVGAAFALQAGLAALVLYFPPGRAALQGISAGVSGLLGFAQAGTEFLFGSLARPEIGGTSFAISALPVIVFFAALIAILYHLGVMQFVIRWIGGGLEKITGISKVESLCAASNIFVGQSESPLVIRPYLAGLAPSQLFCVMSVGMAGVAGTILAAYASMGIRIDYLVAAAFMSAPGGILMAKLIMPDPAGMPTEAAVTLYEDEERPANVIMAASQGAQTGVKTGGGRRRDGAGLCRAGGHGQRLCWLGCRAAGLSGRHLPVAAGLCLRPGVLSDRSSRMGRSAARGQLFRHQTGAQ